MHGKSDLVDDQNRSFWKNFYGEENFPFPMNSDGSQGFYNLDGTLADWIWGLIQMCGASELTVINTGETMTMAYNEYCCVHQKACCNFYQNFQGEWYDMSGAPAGVTYLAPECKEFHTHSPILPQNWTRQHVKEFGLPCYGGGITACNNCGLQVPFNLLPAVGGTYS